MRMSVHSVSDELSKPSVARVFFNNGFSLLDYAKG